MYFNNKNPNLVDEKIVKYHLNKLYNNLNPNIIGGNAKPLLPNPIIPNVQQLSYGLPPLPKNVNISQMTPSLPMQSQPMQQPGMLPQMLPQMQQPQMQQPGMQQPGMQQPGMQQPGMQQPGMLPQNYMYIQPEQPPNFFMKIFLSLKNNLVEFIKENYGFVLIITLLIILLYVRYIEVSKKKKNIKNNI